MDVKNNSASDGNSSSAEENEKQLVKDKEKDKVWDESKSKDKEEPSSFKDDSSHKCSSKDKECGDCDKHMTKYKAEYVGEIMSSLSLKNEESKSSHDKQHKSDSENNEKYEKNLERELHEDGKNKSNPNSQDTDKHSSATDKHDDGHNFCLKSKDKVQTDENRKSKQYNTSEPESLEERSKSRILYLRNFNNWIKAMLIHEYLSKVKEKKKINESIRAHDMCCGKGGDLFKWRQGNITHLICSDMCSVALEHCETRYQKMVLNSRSTYTIEYITADCTRVNIKEKYIDTSIKLDIVSCQFRFHYSFESLPQAECMMKNAAECLQTGGYFIGTFPDCNELLARVYESDTNSFGNEIYNIVFKCDTTTPPLFGAKYNFYLNDGYVKSTEFLIYFPLLVKLAKKYGLKLVRKEKFYDFYERIKSEGANLLTKMKSLEIYPPPQGIELVGNDEDDYEHAKLFVESQPGNASVGTLSKSEWEAASLYLTFAFEKVEGTRNADGVEVYDI